MAHNIAVKTGKFKAQLIRIAFFGAGIVMLASIFFGWSYLVTLFALGAASVTSAFILLGIKCDRCGVSYFHDPAISGWNITGVNLLKPVRSQCRKCGAER